MPLQSPSSPTRVRFIVMAFLCGLSFLTYFDRVCIVRAQRDIQSDLHITDNQMGLVLGAFWLAYGLLEIPGGWMGDRYGARRTLGRIVLAWSIFSALSGAATGFLSLLAYRACFGAGEAGAYPNMARVQSRWLPVRSRGSWGGWLWLLARWGGAFSPILFGALLSGLNSKTWRVSVGRWPVVGFLAHVSAWRIGFWISGLVGLIWVISFFPWFRDDPADMPSVNDAELNIIRSGGAETGNADTHRYDQDVWKALFTNRSLWALSLLYFFGSFGWSFFVSWISRFFLEVHHVKFEKSEIMSGLPLFFGGISCLLGGWLSDAAVRWTGRRRLARALFPIAGCTTAAAAMVAVRFVHTPQQAAGLMCVSAAAYDFGQAANWASIVDIGGAYAGTAAGFVNMIGNLGNSIQPVIGAMIFNHFGWNALFAVYGAAYLVAGSMWIIVNPENRFYSPPSPAPPSGFELLNVRDNSN